MLLPKALVIGCNVKEFWHEDPALLNAYSKAYALRLKDNTDEWKMKVNFASWLNGAYIQSAIASALSKNVNYPNKPFDLFSDEISEKQRIIDSEEEIKRRSKQIDEMLRAAPDTEVLCAGKPHSKPVVNNNCIACDRAKKMAYDTDNDL